MCTGVYNGSKRIVTCTYFTVTLIALSPVALSWTVANLDPSVTDDRILVNWTTTSVKKKNRIDWRIKNLH
jgi:uncharacterized protein (DUF2344 family)